MLPGMHDGMSSWDVITCRKHKQVHDNTAGECRETEDVPDQWLRVERECDRSSEWQNGALQQKREDPS